MPAATLLEPQLVDRAPRPPDGDNWLHEIKYDGYRLLASCERGTTRLYSRSGADWTARLPWIANAITSLGHDVHLDGELVYLGDDGFPDFERLWSATRSGGEQAHLYYQVFDVLRLDGSDLTAKPLVERKARLLEVMRDEGAGTRLRYVSHVQGNGLEFFRAADELGLEGIVSKRTHSVYRAGIRSADWLKVKCFRTQRFSIVGYTTESVAGGEVLATLALAGTNETGKLTYAGRVEFGVPRRDDTLLKALRTLNEPTMAVAGASQSASIVWVEPKLSAEVRALAWRPGRSLRHAVLGTVSII
ncbi:MAG TPA: non-homologous end-joining DNA ligase [Gemmatimonadaceae bacterium]|nr:non-homologous end-joining DNA ligase [Gemmatimonadaceae bacterium]